MSWSMIFMGIGLVAVVLFVMWGVIAIGGKSERESDKIFQIDNFGSSNPEKVKQGFNQ